MTFLKRWYKTLLTSDFFITILFFNIGFLTIAIYTRDYKTGWMAIVTTILYALIGLLVTIEKDYDYKD